MLVEDFLRGFAPAALSGQEKHSRQAEGFKIVIKDRLQTTEKLRKRHCRPQSAGVGIEMRWALKLTLRSFDTEMPLPKPFILPVISRLGTFSHGRIQLLVDTWKLIKCFP